LSLGSAYLPVAVMGGAITAAVLTGTFAFAVVYLILDAAPVVLLARMMRRQPVDGGMIGQTIAVLAIVAMVLMVVALAAMPIDAEGVEATVKMRLGEIIAAASEAGRTTMPNAPETIAAIASFVPGAAAWDWCLRGIVSAALAQTILTRLGEAASPTPRCRTVAVPTWYIAVFWATAAVGWLAAGDVKYVAMNGAAVLCLPLLAQGLAVVHSGFARLDHRTMWLVTFYVLALLMAAFAIVVLVTLGVVEHFLKLRARMATPAQGG
jgi:uncharacterized protein YybS (DUF2232 family)